MFFKIDVPKDAHREQFRFTQFSTRIATWQLLTIFHMFTQSIKFCTFHYHILKEYRFLKKLIHQTDNKNERLLFSEIFTTQSELVFVLTLENGFS